jgi:hypothetical protein
MHISQQIGEHTQTSSNGIKNPKRCAFLAFSFLGLLGGAVAVAMKEEGSKKKKPQQYYKLMVRLSSPSIVH